MAALKHSKQRDSIKNFLMDRYDHPTADMIYMGVREDFPSISLGTVYRNLALLTELGEIIKITSPDGPDRFDGHVEPHSHFICKNCHSVLDIQMENEEFINQAAQNCFPGLIEGHTLHFHGVCSNCIKKS